MPETAPREIADHSQDKTEPQTAAVAPPATSQALSQKLSVWALVLACLWFLPLTLIASVVVGALALVRVRRGRARGRRKAVAALVVATVGILVWTGAGVAGLAVAGDRDLLPGADLLAPGDCMNTAVPTTRMTLASGDYQKTPCTEPHGWETYAAFDLPGAGRGTVLDQARAGCRQRAASFLGVPLSGPSLKVRYEVPPGVRRLLGDRRVACLIGGTDALSSGTLKDLVHQDTAASLLGTPIDAVALSAGDCADGPADGLGSPTAPLSIGTIVISKVPCAVPHRWQTISVAPLTLRDPSKSKPRDMELAQSAHATCARQVAAKLHLTEDTLPHGVTIDTAYPSPGSWPTDKRVTCALEFGTGRQTTVLGAAPTPAPTIRPTAFASLRAGDCFRYFGDDGRPIPTRSLAQLNSSYNTIVDLVPCSQPHRWETYLARDVTDLVGGKFPGDSAMKEASIAACDVGLLEYAGRLAPDDWPMRTYPGSDSWDADRHVICYVGWPSHLTRGTVRKP